MKCVGLDLNKLADVAINERCVVAKQMVLAATSYVRLKHAEEYEALNKAIAASGSVEVLRVYYLSISPSLYEATASAINTVGRPPQEVPMRVVFEKPFGSVRIVLVSICFDLYLSDVIYPIISCMLMRRAEHHPICYPSY